MCVWIFDVTPFEYLFFLKSRNVVCRQFRDFEIFSFCDTWVMMQSRKLASLARPKKYENKIMKNKIIFNI